MNKATSFTRRGQGWPAVCPPVAPAWPSAEQVVVVDGCLVLAVLEEVTVKRVSGDQRKRPSRGPEQSDQKPAAWNEQGHPFGETFLTTFILGWGGRDWARS